MVACRRGSPIELESVDDFHLLTTRTITYIQPSSLWKIRDHTSAGSTSGCPGLPPESLLSNIILITYPPSAAAGAAVNDLTNCTSAKATPRANVGAFFSEKTMTERRRAPRVCVCVCPTLYLRVSHSTEYSGFSFSRVSLGIRAVTSEDAALFL